MTEQEEKDGLKSRRPHHFAEGMMKWERCILYLFVMWRRIGGTVGGQVYS